MRNVHTMKRHEVIRELSGFLSWEKLESIQWESTAMLKGLLVYEREADKEPRKLKRVGRDYIKPVEPRIHFAIYDATTLIRRDRLTLREKKTLTERVMHYIKALR